MLLAQSLFDEFYRELFPDDDQLDAFRLLEGLDNLTLRMGRELCELSCAARSSPEVLELLQEHPPEAVLGALEETTAGRSFVAQLREWLECYGHRGNGLGISEVAWIDDPTPVIRMLTAYLARDDYDPVAEQARLAAGREAAVAAAREALAGFPEAVVTQFEELLAAAQSATVLSEDHDHWIDFRGTHELRRVVRAIGARLTEVGVLEEPGDIVHLTCDEIAQAARHPHNRDLKALVARQTSEIAHFQTLNPPSELGTRRGVPGPDNPMTRTMGKFFGTQPPESTDPRVLRGVGASRGSASGTVKVVRSLNEADKLHHGDILVVETTTPPWTPLFNIAAAVVTDTGGVLSHCAVVAREYGIPAVVGTAVATQILQDGQQVEVDGSAGTVRVIGD
jgi:pyruvate,water dikinase